MTHTDNDDLNAAGPSQGVRAPSGLSSAAHSLPAQAGTERRVVASGIGLSSVVHEVTSVGATI